MLDAMCLKNKLQFLQSIWLQRVTQGHKSFDQKIYQKVYYYNCIVIIKCSVLKVNKHHK
jgi:hypothetical protein